MVLALTLGLSFATGVLAVNRPDDAKNNLCITGKVDTGDKFAYEDGKNIPAIFCDENGKLVKRKSVNGYLNRKFNMLSLFYRILYFGFKSFIALFCGLFIRIMVVYKVIYDKEKLQYVSIIRNMFKGMLIL